MLECKKCGATSSYPKASPCVNNESHEWKPIEGAIQYEGGINGLLILLAIGVVVSPILSLFLLSSLVDFFGSGLFDNYLNASSDVYQPTFTAFIYMFSGLGIVVSACTIVLNYLFFKKKKYFIKFFIFTHALDKLGMILTFAFFQHLEVEQNIISTGTIAIGLTFFLFWILYLRKSDKSKTTFINPSPILKVNLTAFLIAFLISLYVIFQSLHEKTKDGANSNDFVRENVEVFADQLATQTQHQVPIKVDDQTILQKCVANKDTVDYYYQIIDSSMSSIDWKLAMPSLKSAVAENLCNNDALSPWILKGLVIRYDYQIPTLEEALQITLTKQECLDLKK